MSALTWDELNRLAVLAAEQGDNRDLSMPQRERWLDIAMRIDRGEATAADIHAAAGLADEDAKHQRDAKTAQRYRDLAARARAEHPRIPRG